MIDINLLRQQPELVKTSLKNRQKDINLADQAIAVDQDYRSTLKLVEDLRSDQNALGKTITQKPTEDQIAQGKSLKQQLKKLEDQLKQLQLKLTNILELIPNIASDDTPVGVDDADNIVIKTVGEPPKFDFEPFDHVDLGKKLDIIDIDKASQISGARFGYFKNQAAILDMALMNWAFQKLVNKGFTAMLPPLMIKEEVEWKCGYTSNANLKDAYYSIPQDDLIFISSSEHSVVPYHLNEVLDQKLFPIKYVNYSPCFRRESGTYGKDTRGLFRVHHFSKVEMNIFTIPDLKVSDDMCNFMLSIEEELLQELGLPYQVVKCCTGDLPQPNRRMYDINTWFPGQNKYRETQSCSNCTDYQARRLNTKVKIDGENKLVHILNATVVTDRVLLAILENFQTKDHTVTIPSVLQPYTNFSIIKPTN